MAEARFPIVFSVQPANDAATSLKLVLPRAGGVDGAGPTPIEVPRLQEGRYDRPDVENTSELLSSISSHSKLRSMISSRCSISPTDRASARARCTIER